MTFDYRFNTDSAHYRSDIVSFRDTAVTDAAIATPISDIAVAENFLNKNELSAVINDDASVLSGGNSKRVQGSVVAEAEAIQSDLRRPALYWHTKQHGTRIKKANIGAENLAFKSDALKIVRESMKIAYIEHGSIEEFEEDNKLIADSDLNEFLTKKIKIMFASIADIYRANSDVEVRLIGTESGFVRDVEDSILKRIDVPNSRCAEIFSKSVYRSVLYYVSCGGAIDGTWGRISASGPRMYIILNIERRPLFEDDDDYGLEFEL